MNPSSPQIRLALPAEAAAIARMSRDTIEAGLPWRWRSADIERFIASERHNVVVAARGPALCGFAVMSYRDETAYLALLAVAPAARRAGLARRLLDWLLCTVEVAGIACVTVDVREDNLAAQRLYAAAGFSEFARRTGAYDGRVNQVSMRLRMHAGGTVR